MTGEGKGDTERWVDKNSVQYSYAYDKGGKLARAFGIRGIPHSVLIDPSGQIAWRGHPMSLNAGLLRKNLEGAIQTPVWEWPKSVAGVKESLLKQQYAKALDAAIKLSQKDQSLAKFEHTVRSMISAKVAVVRARLDAGDFLGAQQHALRLKKELAGLPAAQTVDEALTSISKDAAAKAIMKAQESLARLKGARIRKKVDAQKIIRRARQLVAKLPGTFVATQANQFITELQLRAKRLR